MSRRPIHEVTRRDLINTGHERRWRVRVLGSKLSELLDEPDARNPASRYGLKKTGAIGVLMRARREGKVASLRAELDRLRNQSGFWIEDRLYQQALDAVGETAEGKS